MKGCSFAEATAHEVCECDDALSLKLQRTKFADVEDFIVDIHSRIIRMCSSATQK